MTVTGCMHISRPISQPGPHVMAHADAPDAANRILRRIYAPSVMAGSSNPQDATVECTR